MGKIITVSGPRGVGKTEVMKTLSSEYDIHPIVPYTTRQMRPGEEDGIDYRFTSHAEFDNLRRTRPMFDVLDLKGNLYGTPLADFEDAIYESTETVRSVNLATNSAIQLRRQLGSDTVRSIFLLPESWDDIETQMRVKGIHENEIQQRRSTEPTDLTLLPEFDQIVINKYRRLGETAARIASYYTQEAPILLRRAS